MVRPVKVCPQTSSSLLLNLIRDLETTSDPTGLKLFTNGEPSPHTVGSISEGQTTFFLLFSPGILTTKDQQFVTLFISPVMDEIRWLTAFSSCQPVNLN